MTFIIIQGWARATESEPAPPEPLEVVVVTATRTPTPASEAVTATEVIDREAIEASGAATVDQLLEMVPGLQLLDGLRGPGLSLGGHDPRHTLVLVDGRRAIGRIGGSLDLRRYPADRIERIEIVRGPTSAVHGADALGGVVQIITREATERWSAELTVTGGGYPAATALDGQAVFVAAEGAAAGLDLLAVDASGGFRAKSVSGRVGVSLQGWDTWDRTPEGADTDGDSQRVLAPTAHLSWSPADHRLTLDLDGLLVDGQGVDASATGAVTDRLHRTESWDVGLGGRFALPREVHLDARLDLSTYRDQLRVDQRLSDALDGYEETREVQGRALLQADGPVADVHHLQAGAELLLESVAADRIDPTEVGRQRGALFVQHTWQILASPRLAVVTGARLELDSRFGVFPAPRVALRLDPHEVLSIRLAAGGGFRAPDFKQLYLSFANPGVGYTVTGNPYLRPERSWGVRADLDLAPHALFGMSLSGWHDSLFDLITTDLATETPGNALYAYVNVGRARVQGLTAAVRLAPREIVSATLAYTLTDADDLDLGRPLPGRAEHAGNATLSVDEPRTRLALHVGATVLGPRPFYTHADPLLATVLGPLGLLDVRLAWSATRQLDLFVGLDNALDAGRSTLDATRPRRLYGGLTLRLAPRSKPAPERGAT